MNKIEQERTDKTELLNFLEQVAQWSTGPIRVACNALLVKHGREGVPLHFPMLRAGPAHSQGAVTPNVMR